MREIKFRSWNQFSKKYDYMSLDTLINGFGDDCPYLEYGENSLNSNNIEQYTGLKDKNGKEIYEGDIVNNSNGIVEIKYYNNLNFDSGGGVHSGFYYSDEVEYYDKGSKYWEVIGNIHENQELINA